MKRHERRSRGKPPKRVARRHPLLHPERVPVARRYRVMPDPVSAPRYLVEVYIAKDRRHMRSLANLKHDPLEHECMGLVRHYCHRTTSWRRAALANGVIARMYLNRRDLRARPSEIVAHECTHAGIAWARFRRETLYGMRSEEVLCYATGRLVSQINRVCHAEGVWR